MSSPSVHISAPPGYLFEFPPASLPESLPPPPSDYTFARPFSISASLYNELLSAKYPITIALTYATTAVLLNQVNRQRGYKPWGFSKTRAFQWFVIAHNVALSVYSFWTFVGMLNALGQSVPGLRGENGLAGSLDGLCKINGPRGLGNAVTFNSTTKSWGVTNELVKLAPGGTPDDTDVGRMWNEGLAFYGWVFYLSKFYEVLDTLIILAKGKRSSSLQTYHHTGAMLSMWAGIRYMAPPIWMFVLVNSGVHGLMYGYYTLTALGVRVPLVVKRTLTTLQISQFVVGISFAGAHLFLSYTVPVSVPYSFISSIPTAVSAASSAVGSAATSIASTQLQPVLQAGSRRWHSELLAKKDWRRMCATVTGRYSEPRLSMRRIRPRRKSGTARNTSRCAALIRVVRPLLSG